MSYVLILGGTKGLGKALSYEAQAKQHTPIIIGRSTGTIKNDPKFHNAHFLSLDLSTLTEADRLGELLITELGSAKALQEITYVFWVASINVRGKITEHITAEIAATMNVTTGGICAIRSLHAQMQTPYHLVTVASSTAWKIRSNETIYGMSKAAQAQGARNFHRELILDLPTSKSSLFNPGGMNTPFWNGTDINRSTMMDPADVATTIWHSISNQQEAWEEYHLSRGSMNSILIETGARAPA